jgi:hypothetical protein
VREAGAAGSRSCDTMSQCAARRHHLPGGVKGPAAGLSQQAGEAEGSPTVGMHGRAVSSPDNDGTGRYCQTVRVRQARHGLATRGLRQPTEYPDRTQVQQGEPTHTHPAPRHETAAHATCDEYWHGTGTQASAVILIKTFGGSGGCRAGAGVRSTCAMNSSNLPRAPPVSSAMSQA